MTRQLSITALALAVGLTAACSTPKTAQTVVQAAQEAMGTVTSLQYTATGANGFVGQALISGEEWPRRDLTTYVRTINYDTRSGREEMTFAMPVFGGQQQNTAVNGDKAWTVGPMGPVPQLAAAEERQLLLWLTPHGFLKGAAAASDATLTEMEGSDVVTFTALGKFKVAGTIDAQNHVVKVETVVANPVLGDTPLVAEYSDYKAFGAVQFPGKIVINQGGFAAWDLTVSDVKANPGLDLAVPAPVASAALPPVQVVSTKIADGVWHLTGGSHHSVVVEFADHIAVIEAPQTDERSIAVLAEAKKLVPNKPVRYLLTTHHHFDHTGGFRTYVAEGATIVTHQSNVDYFEKASAAPATIAPDSLAKSPRKPTFEGVSEKKVLTDGKQTIEIYPNDGDTHTGEYTLIYLPAAKVLVEGDAYSPGPVDAPIPSPAPPNAVKLYDEIGRLKLNVSTIVPIHGRGAVPIAELRKFIGRS